MGVIAQAIRDAPHRATRYVDTHTLCQSVIYLQPDIFQFWNNGWGLELETRGKKIQKDMTGELVELIEGRIDVVPEALSLMGYLKKPTPYKWATTGDSGSQIMHRRAPFSFERWLLGIY